MYAFSGFGLVWFGANYLFKVPHSVVSTACLASNGCSFFHGDGMMIKPLLSPASFQCVVLSVCFKQGSCPIGEGQRHRRSGTDAALESLICTLRQLQLLSKTATKLARSQLRMLILVPNADLQVQMCALIRGMVGPRRSDSVCNAAMSLKRIVCFLRRDVDSLHRPHSLHARAWFGCCLRVDVGTELACCGGDDKTVAMGDRRFMIYGGLLQCTCSCLVC
eukprot:6373735-Amphidinium_carterae.2